jgi:hypothetical protein
MYKVHDNFSAMLIGAEGARHLENAIAFPSCVGGFKDVIQCPAGVRSRGRPRMRNSAEEAPLTALGKRAPRAEINKQV